MTWWLLYTDHTTFDYNIVGTVLKQFGWNVFVVLLKYFPDWISQSLGVRQGASFPALLLWYVSVHWMGQFTYCMFVVLFNACVFSQLTDHHRLRQDSCCLYIDLFCWESIIAWHRQRMFNQKIVCMRYSIYWLETSIEWAWIEQRCPVPSWESIYSREGMLHSGTIFHHGGLFILPLSVSRQYYSNLGLPCW